MTQLLILISAMLGTLTQATYCPMTDLNGSIKWMEMLSAWNTNALIELDIEAIEAKQMSDDEFFAWQDQQEQARLDAIMDQPVEPTKLYNICDDDSWIEAQVANFEAGNGSLLTVEEWKTTLDQPVEHVEDDPYYFIDREAWAACYEAHLAALDKEAEAAHDQHMEAKVWEHHAWQNLVDEVIENLIDSDDYWATPDYHKDYWKSSYEPYSLPYSSDEDTDDYHDPCDDDNYNHVANQTVQWS